MLKWVLLMPAVVFLTLGWLNVRQAPDWSPWKLAVLAGEFGHWLAVGALALATAGWMLRGPAGAAVGAIALVAAGLLLVPTVRAWRIGRELPRRMERELGAVRMSGAAFSAGGWARASAESVPVETFEIAAGLPVDFYRAVQSEGRAAPCVVVVHGGGWDGGDRKQLPELNHWLARRGLAVAAVSYRLAPRHRWPAQREDVFAAIAELKRRAGELGIDAGRLVLLGRSAGGQIAQVVGYTANDPAIRGVIALYAPSDLVFGYVNTHENDMLRSPTLMRQFLGGTPDSARAQYESASALNFVSKSSPPTLLLHGRNDALAWHRHSERLAARLTEHGVKHVYLELPWATHAFDYSLRGPGGQLTTFAVEWFLRAVTK